MPLAGFISDGLVHVINWVIGVGGIFSGFIIGAFFLPLVMLGLHHIFTIHIELINKTDLRIYYLLLQCQVLAK